MSYHDLVIAAKSNQEALVEALLKAGVPVVQSDEALQDGKRQLTPLCYAIKNDNSSMVRLLLSQELRLQLKQYNRYYDIQTKTYQYSSPPAIYCAATQNKWSIVIAIAESYKTDALDEFDFGPTLLLAITAQQAAAVKALVQANALFILWDNHKYHHPLYYSLNDNLMEITLVLLKNIPQSKIDTITVDRAGRRIHHDTLNDLVNQHRAQTLCNVLNQVFVQMDFVKDKDINMNLLNAVLQSTADELAYLETIFFYLLDVYPKLLSLEIIKILLLTDSKIQYLHFFASELMATAIDNILIKEHIVDIMCADDPKDQFDCLINPATKKNEPQKAQAGSRPVASPSLLFVEARQATPIPSAAASTQMAGHQTRPIDAVFLSLADDDDDETETDSLSSASC